MLPLRIETQVIAQMRTKTDENILTPPRTPDLWANRQEGVYLTNLSKQVHLEKQRAEYSRNRRNGSGRQLWKGSSVHVLTKTSCQCEEEEQISQDKKMEATTFMYGLADKR